MSNSMPSLLALLGLVAVAGYQNRDRIAEVIDSARQKQPAPEGRESGGATQGTFGEGAPSIVAGVGELIDRFRSAGLHKPADSWVSTGPNEAVPGTDLERAIGDETLTELSHKTGLTRAELIDRLSAALPDAIDRMTPEGKLPSMA